ncbi:MAG: EAL domain-containing protein [Photobacterium frigidiphilum]|uniref:EAL domain-containing protein n=1 Tax=Photobacterium frigidiphilum TaxID=264736 RepID=UPI003001E9CD
MSNIKVAIQAKTLVNPINDICLSTLDKIKANIYVKRLDGVFVYVNPSLATLIGESPNQIIGSTSGDLYSKEEMDNIVASDNQVFESQQACEVIEVNYVKTFNEKRHFLVHKSPLFGADGKVTGLLGVANDITESLIKYQQLEHSEKRFRALTENSLVGVYMVEAGKFTYVNPKLAEMLGYTDAELMGGLGPLDVAHPDDRELIHTNIRKREKSNIKSLNYKARLIKKDGGIIYVEFFGTLAELNRKPVLIGTLLDISDVIKYNKTIDNLKLKFHSLTEKSLVGVYIIQDGKFIYGNPKALEIVGYPEEEILNRLGILDIGHPGDAQLFKQLITKREAGDLGPIHCQTRLVKKNGEVVHVEVYGTPCYLDGELTIIGTILDVSEKIRFQKALEHHAYYDTLTQLPNRALFYKRVKQAIVKTNLLKKQFAVIFLDLDGFKRVNDTLGHNIGDQLLTQVARRLKKVVRKDDTVSRMGGDEFTMIIEGRNNDINAARVAQKILYSLATPFTVGNETIYISGSLGITLCPDDAMNVDDLLKNADLAMYASKKQGHNRYCFFSPEMQTEELHRMELTNDLHTALTQEQFSLHYQPIIELGSGRIIKAEALIRWHHPTRGMVSPVEFITAAEESKLIIHITDYVFQQALLQVKSWRQRFDEKFQISINTSPAGWNHEAFQPMLWIEELRRMKLPGQAINIEITEGLLLNNTPDITKKLLDFRDSGVSISLDDFGTGYSSLAYLRKLHIDYLKIDRCFVESLSEDSEDMALCEAIIIMAHKLGLKVVAEGIETEQQFNLLAQAGCDYGQGYYFGKPVPSEEFESLFLDRSVEVLLPSR